MVSVLLLCGITSAAITTYPNSAKEHFNLLNDYRESNGKWTLIWDQDLADCLELYLKKQINENFHGHYGPNGDDPTDRCWYLSTQGIWENLIASAWYLPTAQKALELWISSISHKNNMLYWPYKYWAMAVAYDASTKTARRWQIFTVWPLKKNLSSNSSTTWNVWQTNLSSTTPKLLYRSIGESSIVQRWGKKLLRLQLNLDREIDRWKISKMSQIILVTLNNLLEPM